MNPNTKLLTFLVCLMGGVLVGCSEAPAPDPKIPAPITLGNLVKFPAGHPQLALLTLATVEPAQSMRVEMPAKLVWNEERTQRVYPSFAGRVISIKTDVGQSVKAGTPLAQLASPDFGQAQSETSKAEVEHQLAQKALLRQQELFAAGIIARKDLELAQADAERAQAEQGRAQAKTRLYGSTGGINQQLVMSASIGGLVVERNLNPGQELRPDMSGPGVPALFVVTDPTSLWLQIDVRESELGDIKAGTPFELTIPTLAGRKFQGRVLTTSDFIDPMTRTIKVRGAVSNPDRVLKAEMLGKAKFERTFSIESMVIPASASLLRATTHVVFVQPRPGEFERRVVEIDYEGPDRVVVRGLQAGEKVVIENALLLARQFRLDQQSTKTDSSDIGTSSK